MGVASSDRGVRGRSQGAGGRLWAWSELMWAWRAKTEPRVGVAMPYVGAASWIKRPVGVAKTRAGQMWAWPETVGVARRARDRELAARAAREEVMWRALT